MNEPADQSEPRRPLMSPGFWLHHAALAWQQVFGRRLRPLNLTPTQFMLMAPPPGWARRPDDDFQDAAGPGRRGLVICSLIRPTGGRSGCN